MKKTFVPTRWTLVFLLCAAMLTLMGGAAVAPALPLISQVFPDVPEYLISMIITLPSLAVACTGYLVGMACDRFGRKPILLLSLVIFSVAGSAGFFLDSFPAILASRAVLGIGIAGLMTATTALITEYYTGASRVKVLGYQSAAMGLGILILETGGGTLAEISWREPFLIYLVGFVILLGAIFAIKEPAREPTHGLRDSSVKLNMRALLPIYVTIFIGMAIIFLMPTKLPYLISAVSSTSLMGTGVLLGLMGFCAAVTGIFYGRIAARMPRMQVMFLCFLVLGVGCCLMGFAESVAAIAVAVILVGAGNGALIPTIVNWISNEAPIRAMGKATGIFSMSLNLGQFGSSLLVVPILVIVGSYSNLFLVTGLFAILISLIYAVVWRRGGQSSETS
ncbi:MFS transporter [Methanorbis furvi]|uniref:Tetracycline resistance protein, class B n=1 Tax=Methanorbis furvi TaxID=3028299 RepID=A0AAE4S9K1_9EURY|nr:Tetracycline resistance protein, class B [Methanocorpusculaceae archaeon Ag1]